MGGGGRSVIRDIRENKYCVFLSIVTVASMILLVWCIATPAKSGSAMDVVTPLAGRLFFFVML